MNGNELSRAALGRMPLYLRYLRGLPPESETISATAISKELGLGEVQVRKDLGAVCGAGKPKLGYPVGELTGSIERALSGGNGKAVLIGAGRLGQALMDYRGFSDYGLRIIAAFDSNPPDAVTLPGGTPVLPLDTLDGFCRREHPTVGIITVPEQSAQEALNRLCDCGIRAVWCFTQRRLYMPAGVTVRYENMALSLAHLMRTAKHQTEQLKEEE